MCLCNNKGLSKNGYAFCVNRKPDVHSVPDPDRLSIPAAGNSSDPHSHQYKVKMYVK